MWKFLSDLEILKALVAAVVVVIVGAVWAWYFSPTESQTVAMLLPTLRMPSVDNITASHFILRPQLEADILKGPSSTTARYYTVVVGSRGVGKSVAVRHALKDRAGVIYVTPPKPSDTLAIICEQLTIFKQSTATLASALRPAIDTSKIVPVIVVEHRTTSHEAGVETDLKEVARTLKELCVDEKVARCLLVLSDANAVYGLPDDAARQRIVWVDDFTQDEGEAYFDKWNFLPVQFSRKPPENADVSSATVSTTVNNTVLEDNSKLRKLIFEQVGQRAVLLRSIITVVQLQCNSKAGIFDSDNKCEDGSTLSEKVQAFVAEQKEIAFDTLGRLLLRQHSIPEASALHFQCLVSMLLRTTDDVGVKEPSALFLAAPVDASVVIKKFHAVQYHLPSRTYRFASVAHRRAAETWRQQHAELDEACDKIKQNPKR